MSISQQEENRKEPYNWAANSKTVELNLMFKEQDQQHNQLLPFQHTVSNLKFDV